MTIFPSGKGVRITRVVFQSTKERPIKPSLLTLKALSFFLPVQHWGVFSTPLCNFRSRHPRKLKFTGLRAYIIFYKISKLESLTIINDVILTSLQKQWEKLVSCTNLHKI